MSHYPNSADGARAGRNGSSCFFSHFGMCVGLFAALLTGIICQPARAADPVAANGTASVQAGESVTIELAATDADEDDLTYIIVSPLPTEGDVSVGGDELASSDLPYTIPSGGNTIVFTADSSADGEAEIVFVANDGTADSSEATVTVTINRPPVADGTTTFYTEIDRNT